MIDKSRLDVISKYGSNLLPKSLTNILTDEERSDDSNKSLKSSEEPLPRQYDENANKKRRWFSIILAWVTIFASMAQFTMFSGILAPYLAVLEPGIPKDFASWTVMAFSIGQMFTAPLFGWWSNKIQRCRLPTVVGIVILIIGTIAFLCLELFPIYARRWAMLFIRVLIGIGSNSYCVARSYCATASTKSERSKAVAGSTCALGLAVIAGPGAQGLFAMIGYPGFSINTFHFHMYNAPAYANLVFLLLLLILNGTILLEEYPGVEKTVTTDPNAKPLPKFDKFGVFILIWCWFCCWTMLTTFVMLGVPFTQAQFDWSLPEALFYNGGVFGAFAVLSLIVYTLYAFHGQKVDDRIASFFGMCLMLFFWLLTLPWPGYPMPTIHADGNVSNHATINQTTNYASNLTFYNTSMMNNMSDITCKYVPQSTPQSWCFNTPRIPVILYWISFTLLAVGFPLCNSALSALLPKIVGPRRQGTTQGLLAATGGVGRLLGPLVISLLFSRYGPKVSWSITVVLISSGILVATVFRKRLVPLDANPKLKPGEFYHYKQGVVYRL